MSKKQLHVTGITNELAGGASLFFAKPKGVVPSTPQEGHRMPEEAPKSEKGPVLLPPQRNSEVNTTPVRPVRVVPPTSQTQPKKRVMKTRHPFDIYQDQYEDLQQLSLKERMQGGTGSMSAMVREALDKFISERKKK